jgi:hypothetical protein
LETQDDSENKDHHLLGAWTVSRVLARISTVFQNNSIRLFSSFTDEDTELQSNQGIGPRSLCFFVIEL